VAADEEWLPFAPASFDLVVASLSLHWVNDLPGALIQLRQALRPDGCCWRALPGTRHAGRVSERADRGGSSADRWRRARVSPFPDLRDCAALLQRAGFALPVADVEEIRLLYADPYRLPRDLRAAGEANAVALRDRRTPPRRVVPGGLGGAADARRAQRGPRCGWR